MSLWLQRLLTIALYFAIMAAVGYFVATPFADWGSDWYVKATEDWPYAAQMAGIVAIPVICFVAAYFAYKRDHRKGTIQSQTFWRYIRTGK